MISKIQNIINKIIRLDIKFNSLREKIVYFLNLTTLSIFLGGLLFLITSPIKSWVVQNTIFLQTAQTELNGINMLFQESSLVPVLIFVVLGLAWTVLFEEITFRNLLTTNKLHLILIGLILSFSFFYYSPVIILTIILIYNSKKITHFNIGIVSLCFGFLHVTSFINSNLNNLVTFQIILLLPFLASPYFVVGYCLGLIKVNLGIKWSVLAHFSFNICVILVASFLK